MELHSRIAGRERTLSVIAPAGSEKKNGGCCVSITFSFVATVTGTHIVPRPWMMLARSMSQLQFYGEPFSALLELFELG